MQKYDLLNHTWTSERTKWSKNVSIIFQDCRKAKYKAITWDYENRNGTPDTKIHRHAQKVIIIIPNGEAATVKTSMLWILVSLL